MLKKFKIVHKSVNEDADFANKYRQSEWIYTGRVKFHKVLNLKSFSRVTANHMLFTCFIYVILLRFGRKYFWNILV
jgi:hypothetical protein